MIDILTEVWAQRHTMTAYDAMYVFLARLVGVPAAHPRRLTGPGRTGLRRDAVTT